MTARPASPKIGGIAAWLLGCAVAFGCAVAGCAPEEEIITGTGGTTPGTGGAISSSGGVPGSGGAPGASGGAIGTGGMASGGTGSGGAPVASGGMVGGGGATATGGAPATGGAAAGGRATGGGMAGGGGTRTGGAGGGVGGGSTPTAPITVFIASDSTASTYAANAANMQAGWGQYLAMNFNGLVKVSNQAIGGRSSRRFINEGRLTTILNAMKSNDHLLVQFGTNDGNKTATYDDGEPYYVSTTEFQTYMNQFIDGARTKGGVAVLVTPPPRATCTGDSHEFGNGLLGYSDAMKTVAAAKNVALVDLNAKTLTYINSIGCIAAKANFYLLNDGTHFQQNGARLMAGFVADGIVAAGVPLGGYRLP